MGYWDETDRIIAENGGRNPTCPDCEQEMFPIDDHGRFFCSCKPISSLWPLGQISSIPQVSADVILTDEQKKEIPAINRLHLSPTKEEQEFFIKTLGGLFSGADSVSAKKRKKSRKRKR